MYSVIGGYLAPSFARIAELCREAGVPLIVDGAHAHYLDAVVSRPEVDIAYSFYATKVLPAGEGGLVSTADEGRHAWVRRFLMYDRFDNELQVGLNLRAWECTLRHRRFRNWRFLVSVADRVGARSMGQSNDVSSSPPLRRPRTPRRRSRSRQTKRCLL